MTFFDYYMLGMLMTFSYGFYRLINIAKEVGLESYGILSLSFLVYCVMLPVFCFLIPVFYIKNIPARAKKAKVFVRNSDKRK